MAREWTTKQREDAARRSRLNRPWAHSTGPRTAQGKRASSRNSYKHGYYSFEKQFLRWYVRYAALRLKQHKAFRIMQNHKHRIWKETRNELTRKYYKWNDNPFRFPLDFMEKAQKIPKNPKNPLQCEGQSG